MAEAALPIPPPRRLRFDLVLPTLFRPRAAFTEITNPGSHNGVSWLTPMLILTGTVLLSVIVAGIIQQRAAANNTFIPPEGFEFFSPEQQAMMEQGAQASPTELFVLPTLLRLGGLWFGWLVLGGILYLALTLFGGRGHGTISLVAWASLPLAVRDIVQILAMLLSGKTIPGQGLSGFAPMADGIPGIFAGICLGLIDIYLIWQLVLLVVGVKVGSGVSTVRAVISVILTVLLVMFVQSVLATGIGMVGSVLTGGGF